MSETTVTVREATYIDPRSNADKFYRTFAYGTEMVTQYGRNGTIGTFTAPVSFPTADKALAAADKKFASKVAKGYNPTRQGTLTINGVPDTGVLDELVAQVPVNESHDAGPSREVAAVVVAANTTEAVADRTDEVTSEMFPMRAALPEDVTPKLAVRPMLAEIADTAQVPDMIDDSGWWMQYKYDGDRVVIEVIDGQVSVLNRQGQPKVRNIGAAHLAPFRALGRGRWVFDGEIVGRTLVLFDLLMATDGENTFMFESLGFLSRWVVLNKIAKVLGLDSNESFVMAPVATDANGKARMLAEAKADRREGVMLRRVKSPYDAGRRSLDLLKYKFTNDADVIITALHPEKESATLSVYSPEGDLREVGRASTIGKRAADLGGPQVGQVWLTTFLYTVNAEHPRMFQPRLVSERTDKSARECSLAQFAGTVTNKIV